MRSLILTLALLATSVAAHTYHRDQRFVAGFDEALGGGVLLHTVETGGFDGVYTRPGYSVDSIHDHILGETRVLVVMWRSLTDGDRLSPSVWVEVQDGDRMDLFHAWPPEPGSVEWDGAQLRVRSRGEKIWLSVARNLDGENQAEPFARKMETFEITAGQVRLTEQKFSGLDTPDQILNALEDRVQYGDLNAIRKLLGKLPKDEAHLGRAAILLGRVQDPGVRAAARTALRELTARDNEVAGAAADRLLEMAWEDLGR